MSQQTTTIPGLSIEQYSDRALAVFITDKNVKSNYHIYLTACLGGKHNPSLRAATPDGPKREGYIFGLKQQAQITKQLQTEYERIRAGGRPVSILPSSSSSTSSTPSPTTASQTSTTSSSALSGASSGTSSSATDKLVQSLTSRVEALEAELLAIRSLLSSSGINLSLSQMSLSSQSKTTKPPPSKRAKVQSTYESEDELCECEDVDSTPQEAETPSLIKRKPQKN